MQNSKIEQEMLTVRKFNRELLLTILDAKNFPNEEHNALTNIISYSRIKAVMAVIAKLYEVGYTQDLYRSAVTDSMRSASWKEKYEQIMAAMEYENDMISARGLLIDAIGSMCVEQKSDLGRLLMLEHFSSLHNFDIYCVHSREDVSWLPEKLNRFE